MTQHNLYANMKKFIASQNGALKYTFTVVISISLSCNEFFIDSYQIRMIYIVILHKNTVNGNMNEKI